METLNLTLMGEDSWSRPVYKDQNDKLWKDTTLGSDLPSLHSSLGNLFDGEPDMPIRGEYVIINLDKGNE